jgi:pimeloyl-ACP methyl ester carboxylesterase
MPARIGEQAVVVGAGMGGLTAARALVDFFEHVIVLENDTLPKEATHRPGTPQSKHIHALLAGGQQALSRLFSGFVENLSQAGAVRLRMGYDDRIERPGYDPFPQRDLGISFYGVTRPLLEFTVRKRLLPPTPGVRSKIRTLQDTRDYWSAGKSYYEPEKVRVPALIVVGEWDHDNPPFMAQELFLKLINTPYKQMVQIGEATHMMMLEKNRMQVFRAVQAFLDDPGPRP